MLTERLIVRVFDMERFARQNVIAGEIEKVIDALTSRHFNYRDFLGALDRFYDAIERAADELATFSEKQQFLNTVYERFFQGYSVKEADTFGIVYTPPEIVDFMCAAVEEVLETEFGLKLSDDSVCVIDPCTGTGSFAVNLLRRGHARNRRNFDRFYREQLFANEVMLMPYYIASLNIEHTYHELTGEYKPFDGICFVDTLDLAEGSQMRFSFMTERNTERVERQKRAPITVIIGNPPYNVGQLNENDNNKNRKYEVIDSRIAETYVNASKATLRRQVYDPYVKFFRWATDRLQGRDGIVCFVSNNSFVDQIAFDGMRKHLLEDYTKIYHLDLHGNVRQNPKLSGTTHNVFGIQVGVGITVAVRSPNQQKHRLMYFRVPEFWRKEEKLAYLAENVTLEGKQNALNTVRWEELEPDTQYTWLVPEHAGEFKGFLPLGIKGDRKADVEAVFQSFSSGVKTGRDDVIYDFIKHDLAERIEQFCSNYNAEVDRYRRTNKASINIDEFVDYQKLKWSRNLKRHLVGMNYLDYDPTYVRVALYRPFTLKQLYFSRIAVDEVGQFFKLFPLPTSDNLLIQLKTGADWPVFALMANRIVDLLPQGGSQCFPFSPL